MHETLHALGVVHEHTRPDRDDYVEVLEDNIQEGIFLLTKCITQNIKKKTEQYFSELC